MPDPAPLLSRQSSREIYEALYRYIGQARIHTVVLPHNPRHVRQRNTEERPRTADAVLLDDVWKALEDVLLAEEGS